jgi:pyrroloquinoline quinone biosynthesis protein D
MTDELVVKINPMFRFQWEEAQNNFVLLYPEGMVKLSQSAGEIMKRINGESSVIAIIEDLENTFAGANLRADVLSFIEQATKNGWISS